MQRFKNIDWARVQREAFNIFTKLIRTKDPRDGEPNGDLPTRSRLLRCLSTLDLTSLGVGSCVGTGMYLVCGMVAHKFAGPGVIFSFIIAAVASIFSGACYAEFGVRVPHTSGSAYMYSYVTVGEFVAFIIGWNMVLEYLIGTSACARALSACADSLIFGQATHNIVASRRNGKQVDFVACIITILMMIPLVAGVKKSLLFNNILNGVNLCVWVFIMTAGLFYVDIKNWNKNNEGFLPYGWRGVFSGAATCFYAFIGFDIIATTGEEAQNPKRSIPLAIVLSLGIILTAYVSTSVMLTLVVPYDEIDTDSAVVQMFSYVHAPYCKYIVGIGALAGLTVSMFGSMFPMPRVIYAMASDGLIFKHLSKINEYTGTPAVATVVGGLAAAAVALFIQLEVLVEMMSIGTLLAYTLVSTCVLVLRYQPHSTNLIELLPQSMRTPIGADGVNETAFTGFQGELSRTNTVMGTSHPVMVRRVTRSSPDSDDTMPGDDSEEFGRDDTSFLVTDRAENAFYVGAGSSHQTTAWSRFCDAWRIWLQEREYLCPGVLPWTDVGPATDESGLFVIRATGVMYVMIILFDLFAAYGNPGTSSFTNWTLCILFTGIIVTLLMISRKPQNKTNLLYATPALPFVPAIAITVNIYLILNLSLLTLLRFTIWMTIGLIIYFKYGIRNSVLEANNVRVPPPPPPAQPSVLQRTTLPPRPPASPRQPTHDRNIFEGDNNMGPYGYGSDPLLAWHDADSTIPNTSYVQIEQRFNTETNRATSHATRPARPPWAAPDSEVWDD